MFPAFLLSLREGLEIALVLGIVLGAVKKMQRPDARAAVWLGAASAAAVSLLAAVALQILGASLEGPMEWIFEGITMLLAAGVLTWMIFWMQRQARGMKSELEAGVRQAIHNSGKTALFLLAFVAVVREGVELALFFTAAALATDAAGAALGAVLGLAGAALLGYLLFSLSVRLDLRRFFQVTGVLLILFAAGLVAHGIHELNEAGLVPAVVEHVWDVNPLLHEKSVLGQTLTALFGYNGNPSLTEVLAYLLYFTLLFFGLRWNSSRLASVSQAAAD